MKYIRNLFLSLLFVIILQSLSVAQTFYTWRYRNATDCTVLTDGKPTDLCHQPGDSTLYKCNATDGTCDTPTEWIRVNAPSYINFTTNETVDISWDKNFTTTKNITADHFIGNGSALVIRADDLSDVASTAPAKDQVLKWNGTSYVPAVYNASFTFSVASFTNNGGSTTVEIGTGDWKAIGALTFNATYNNGPATNGTISHTGWTNLTMGGTGFVGPTVSTTAVTYPATVAGTKAFTLTATDGATNAISTSTFTFVNKRFWGVSSTTGSYSEADIEGLANNELSNTGSKTFTVTAGAGEYIIWASRTALGTRSFTVGGFEGGFQAPETVSVTNPSGFMENYYIYRSTNPNLGNTTVVVS